jgi:spermidine dehydrogenase
MRGHDRELGMDRPIRRRVFLNGIAATAGPFASGMLPGMETEASMRDAAVPGDGADYPPRLTGLRGSHPGSFELAHELRDGLVSIEPPCPAETYDLVIVSGGISGLAAFSSLTITTILAGTRNATNSSWAVGSN